MMRFSIATSQRFHSRSYKCDTFTTLTDKNHTKQSRLPCRTRTTTKHSIVDFIFDKLTSRMLKETADSQLSGLKRFAFV
jgi:hypothetical protein